MNAGNGRKGAVAGIGLHWVNPPEMGSVVISPRTAVLQQGAPFNVALSTPVGLWQNGFPVSRRISVQRSM